MSNSEIIGAGQDTERRVPKMQRSWAMPNSLTFSIKPIRELIGSVIADCSSVCDPFVRNSPFKARCVSNDLDTSIEADFHMDARDFMSSRSDSEFDGLLFDPPYSVRQVAECYKKMGLTVNMETTQSSFWTKLKKEVARIVKPCGVVVCCGWNSGGIGKTFGFDLEQILLVPHGGPHNDTIVTVERRTSCAKNPTQYTMDL
jgi:hypothetical protein